MRSDRVAGNCTVVVEEAVVVVGVGVGVDVDVDVDVRDNRADDEVAGGGIISS